MNEQEQPNNLEASEGTTPDSLQQPDQQAGEGAAASPSASDYVPTPPPSPYEDAMAAPQQPCDTAHPFYAASPSQQPSGYDVAPQQAYGAPQQPYGYQPPAQQAMPAQPYGAPQQPYGYQQPYGAPQQPQQPYSPEQPVYQVYPPAPPYPPQKPKRKVWPWVLGGCLLVLLLGIGGCVGCTLVVSSLIDEVESSALQSDSGRSYSYDHFDGSDDSSDSSSSNDPSDSTYTRSEIDEAMSDLPSKVENDRCTPGVYEVGPNADIKPGLYYLEGSQTEESWYYVFEKQGSGDAYEIDDSVVYFGNYFTELETGDLIAFDAPESARMYLAPSASVNATPPYQSGVYRVGTDIEAGTYTVSVQKDAAAATDIESAAYVMQDLEFDSDSIVDKKYVIAGSSQTITVKDGQYVELFAATMVPSN